MKKNLFFVLLSIMLAKGLLAQTSLLINTTEEKELISKYVYGQFIEHLGKSIYSGLWSEMILDRKFFFPVNDNYDPWGEGQPDSWWGGSTFPYLKASPWKVLGAAGSVTMDSLNPYVGKYAAVIHLTGDGSESGIAQEVVSIVNGKSYTGRIIISGDSSAAPILVRILTKGGDTISQQISSIDTVFANYPISLTSDFTSDSASFEVVSSGKGSFKIGILSLMPADNIDGWRADVVQLLKELNSPIYRWPGGNFVSGYDWRNGIGEQDKRIPTKNPAWTGIEPSDVGIHEFMNLMQIINSEPFIALNMGLGTVEDAVAEVEYCNSDTNTVEGKVRAKNGHPEPFHVTYWAVGNEMFGSWQLGNMPLTDYEAKHNLAAQAIYTVDSTAQLVAVGDIGSNWSQPMLTVCGDYMNLLSEHRYCKESSNIASHVNAIANEISSLSSTHRTYRKNIAGLAAKDIRIALDEYNYWYGPNPYGQLGIVFHQKDALGVAAALHEMYKNSDLIFMANYAQTVNVLGCIKVTATASDLEATALPLVLYRKHFGTVPVNVTGTTTTLNVSAAFTPGKDSLTVGIINSQAEDIYYKVNMYGSRQKAGYQMWTIANPDPLAYNEPGKEPVIKIVEAFSAETIDSVLIPAYGNVLVKFPVEPYISGLSEIHDGKNELQVFQNPSSHKTTIEYRVEHESLVNLRIMDISGREIVTLVNKIQLPGKYTETWDAENIRQGEYYCCLTQDNHTQTNKLVLIL